jgi:hypothetical protein
METVSDTREFWLTKLTARLRPVFEAAGYTLPEKIRSSCGFPSRSALATKARRVGEAWSCELSADSFFETFVSPLVSDGLEVAAIQVHELVHVAVGLKCGHRGKFSKCAKALGLVGKMKVTEAGEELKVRLQTIIDVLGPYPHAKLMKSNAPPKQGTRMLKIECPLCGYTCRSTKKWLEVGVPTCPCGTKMVGPDLDDEEDGEDYDANT